MIKGQKFYYMGELVTYTYYSTKYNSYHFSNSVCKDNQLVDIQDVMKNQEYHKNWKPEGLSALSSDELLSMGMF